MFHIKKKIHDILIHRLPYIYSNTISEWFTFKRTAKFELFPKNICSCTNNHSYIRYIAKHIFHEYIYIYYFLRYFRHFRMSYSKHDYNWLLSRYFSLMFHISIILTILTFLLELFVILCTTSMSVGSWWRLIKSY